MGLVDSISRNRRFWNGDRHTTDFGHCMKGSQEAQKKRTHPLLSNRFFHGFAASLNIVGIKLVEDLKIFLVVSGDLGMDDGCVQGTLRSPRVRVWIGMKVIG